MNRTNGVWSTPLNVSLSSDPSYSPRISFDASGNIHLVWSDGPLSNIEIYYTNRTNGVWSSATRISQLPGTSRYPHLAFDLSGNLHVVWSDDKTLGGNADILYSNRTNGVWSSPLNITNTPSVAENYPKVVFDSSGVMHIVFAETVGGDDLIYLNRTGGVWSSPFIVYATSYIPDLNLDSGNNLHFVWSGGDVFHCSFTLAQAPDMTAGSTGSSDWSYSNLNTLIAPCSCPSCSSNGTHCTIGLNFTSQSAGAIQLSNLQITYT
jgi:hypothetical protein